MIFVKGCFIMDIQFLLWFQKIREVLGPGVEILVSGVSMLSTVAVFVLFLVYWCLDRKTGRFGLLCFSVGQFLNQTCKAVFCIPRPWIRNEAIHPSEHAIESASGYSFPSGHSQTAMSSYGALSVKGTTSRWIRVILLVCILLVGLSRNYLGVHTPQDVLVGFGMGILSIVIVAYIQKHKEKLCGFRSVIAGICIVASATAYVVLKQYPGSVEQAVLMKEDAMKAYGFMAGTIVSAYYMQTNSFTTDHLSIKQRIRRALIGSVMIAPVYFGGDVLLAVFLPMEAALWICTFASAITGILLVPYVFNKVEKRTIEN